MRIVAGSARGRPLVGPKGKGIRPTSDRVRESLFNILGQYLEGGAVLDLFAGTGALALEALSRGADRAVLVDSNREAIELCTRNAETLGFSGQVKIWHRPVSQAAALLGKARDSFQLIFADPPYALEATGEVLALVAENRLLTPGGTLVLEHAKEEVAPEEFTGLVRFDTRRFGDTQVSFYRCA